MVPVTLPPLRELELFSDSPLGRFSQVRILTARIERIRETVRYEKTSDPFLVRGERLHDSSPPASVLRPSLGLDQRLPLLARVLK